MVGLKERVRSHKNPSMLGQKRRLARGRSGALLPRRPSQGVYCSHPLGDPENAAPSRRGKRLRGGVCRA
eukprot:11191243-Lingulodinium_polyedra.AAC.1